MQHSNAPNGESRPNGRAAANKANAQKSTGPRTQPVNSARPSTLCAMD
jgi:hypothetical protein